ncbi:MAG: DUF523 domain-containing protein [Epsilonproteobacteria bacterium]|nr:DUF523 domain-containing protein [Campylobacterota bacterium]
MKPKCAISACLLGNRCRYDGTSNYDPKLIGKLKEYELIPFCPEDFCFGTPRPTMDLVKNNNEIKAISNLTGANLTPPIKEYANAFFDTHKDIKLFIGKDRSPSCGVRSAKLYNKDKELINSNSSGLMAKEAIKRGIKAFDAEEFLEKF